jgi:hypothetical protein
VLFLAALLTLVELIAVIGLVVLELNHRVHFAPAEAEEVGPARLISSGQRVDHSQCIPFLNQLFEPGCFLVTGEGDALELAGVAAANEVVLLKKKSVMGSASSSLAWLHTCSAKSSVASWS